METTSRNSDFRTNLRRTLMERFDETELRNLAFDLGVDYDILPGNSKNDKARELIAYLHRRDNVGQLIEIGRKSRPDIDWDSLVGVAQNTKLESPPATWSQMDPKEKPAASEGINRLDTIWRD